MPFAARRELQNVVLIALRCAHLREPARVDHGVASGTGTAAAALRSYARHAVVYGAIHDGVASGRRVSFATAVRLHENNGRH